MLWITQPKVHWPSCSLWVQITVGESKRQHLHQTVSYPCFIFPPTEIQLHRSNSKKEKVIFSISWATPMQSNRINTDTAATLPILPSPCYWRKSYTSARSVVVCSQKQLLVAHSSHMRCQGLDAGCSPVAKATLQWKVKNINFKMASLPQLCSSWSQLKRSARCLSGFLSFPVQLFGPSPSDFILEQCLVIK